MFNNSIFHLAIQAEYFLAVLLSYSNAHPYSISSIHKSFSVYDSLNLYIFVILFLSIFFNKLRFHQVLFWEGG